MNKKIKFSEEWDKIQKENRVVGRRFTTARGYEPRKHKYYEYSVGEIFDVMLKGEKIGEAGLVGIEFKWPHDIPPSFWKQDTYSHYEWEDVKQLMEKFYGIQDPFLIILYFEWTKVEEEE